MAAPTIAPSPNGHGPIRRLQPQHAELVRGSAISEEVAAARGYFSVSAPAELAELGFPSSQQLAPALIIPIRDVRGQVAFHQARPDSPRTRDGKRVKYETPARERLVLDVPAAVHAALPDASRPLWITEGSRKADAAVSIGLDCIALIGVWGFARREEKGGPLVPYPDWQAIALKGRRVYVAFDSDVMVKREVRKALATLHAFLLEQGAQPRLVYLPGGPDDAKVGLDDFLAAGHTELDLLELATPELASAPGSSGKGPTQAEHLVEWVCGGGAELFHTPDRKPYATVTVGGHRETMALESADFRDYLGRAAHENGTVGEQAIKDATARLRSQAIYDGPEHEVHVRLAATADAIFLDLGDAGRRSVEIRGGSWRVLEEEPPVKFWRPAGMRPLPIPEPGGDLDELALFVNLADESAWQLLVGWLVGCLSPSGPYPLLVLHGEQGSAKSTTARLLRSLIDPARPELRAAPADERDLFIGATRTRILAFDNLSRVPAWLSDALCRIADGGGFAVRKLYADGDEQLFEVERPIILNGIEALPERPDLLERSVMIELPRLSEAQRQTPATIWRLFEEKRPRLLGALLDAAAGAHANYDQVEREGHSLPRMAQHATFVTAAEAALGWEPGTYLATFAASREETTAAALECSPLWPYLADAADGQERTMTELLEHLGELAGEAPTRARAWPKRPRDLSGAIKRLSPDLDRVGITADRVSTGSGSSRRNSIVLRRNPKSNDPSDPSDPTALQSRILGPHGGADGEAGAQNGEGGVAEGRNGVADGHAKTSMFPGVGSLGSLGSQDSQTKKTENGVPGPSPSPETGDEAPR